MINAARVLAARPKSKVAQENIDVFRDAWINQVCAFYDIKLKITDYYMLRIIILRMNFLYFMVFILRSEF